MEDSFSDIIHLFEGHDHDTKNLIDFCEQLFKRQRPKEYRPMKEDLDLSGLFYRGVENGFALGYLFGQTFDVLDKKATALLGELKQKLTNEDLLKYVPKVREDGKPAARASMEKKKEAEASVEDKGFKKNLEISNDLCHLHGVLGLIEVGCSNGALVADMDDVGMAAILAKDLVDKILKDVEGEE